MSSGKKSPKRSQTISTRLEKNPGLALRFSEAKRIPRRKILLRTYPRPTLSGRPPSAKNNSLFKYNIKVEKI